MRDSGRKKGQMVDTGSGQTGEGMETPPNAKGSFPTRNAGPDVHRREEVLLEPYSKSEGSSLARLDAVTMESSARVERWEMGKPGSRTDC